METTQYNAALTITGAKRGSSKERLYQELGLETLQQRLWYRKLCCFYKNTKITDSEISLLNYSHTQCHTEQGNVIKFKQQM